MMIPDYALIAEIMLFSEGFQTTKDLAQKTTQLYKPSSEQLSQQDHYDFGMRAVKSALVMAGALKRKYDTLSEDTVLIYLFPGVNIPPVEHAILQQSLTSVLKIQGMQPAQQFILKCLQVYETMEVRWGLMLVGETGTGKTTCLRALCNAFTEIHEQVMAQALDDEEIELQSTYDADKLSLTPSSQQLNATVSQNKTIKDDLLRESFCLAKTTTLNPKAVTMGELYSEFNEITREWHDCLIPYYVKEMLERSKEQANKVTSEIGLYSNVSPHIAQKHKLNIPTREIMAFDGLVDAIWIESMNSVLDDNKILCLSNGDRIKLINNMTILFEVQDLRVASPATVSKCSMIYLEKTHLGLEHIAASWKDLFVARFPHLEKEQRLEECRRNKRKWKQQDSFTEFIPNTTTGIVASLLELFTSLADSYASTHTSKIADAQYQLRMDAVTGAGGRREKKGDQKKAEKEKEAKHNQYYQIEVHTIKE
ncbi:MAG: putative dynein heavy chain [Streblomastix strix]|uniref:Putative dynein heavy chain n=1 Tax=Streblomastix strix TaxID=222440 RepID=A0A5J4U632_9EUKA|nr:MAG: putative dynein heavy chain [Streblomastix strix]